MTKQVEDFIRIKATSEDKKVKIISNVTYRSDYKTVDYKSVLKWLGTLLDNALEASNEHPIYIHVGVTSNRLALRIANEYIGDIGQDLQVIFEKGYTTKGENKGRGIGLHNLHQEVTKKEGEITLDVYYTEDHNCNYLQVSIWFSTNT
jgi:sensor histidine kinase regulating citrate/malate metabolism